MRKLAERIDKIATEIEGLGLKSLATDLDIVSNTLDKLAFIERGEVSPFDVVDFPEVRYQYLENALNLLGSSELGESSFVVKVKRALAGHKTEIMKGETKPFMASAEVEGFNKWLESLAAKHGEKIPGSFFKSGQNRYGDSFKDLGAMLHIMDEKITGGVRKVDTLKGKSLEEFSKDLSQTPKEHKWDFSKIHELEKAYENREAAGFTIPSKFRMIESTLHALKPAAARY